MRIGGRISRTTAIVAVGAVLMAAGAIAGTVTVGGGIVSAATTVLQTPAAATFTYSPAVTTTATTPVTTVSTSCIVWPASLDGWVSSATPTGANPNPTSLSVSAVSTATKYALIQFTLPASACPGLAGGEVKSASLQLWISTQVTGRVLNVDPVTSAWTSAVTWNTKPTVGSAVATVTLTSVAAKQYSIDVTNTIGDLVRTGGWPVNAPQPPFATPAQQTNYGFELLNPTTANPDTISIIASHNTQNRQRPQLVIDYSY
jgi:hypothetical protein